MAGAGPMGGRLESKPCGEDREILRAIDLAKAFGGVQAVSRLSFGLARGELLALIGPNGAGKTSCFHLLHGHLKPDQGYIYLNNQEIPYAFPISSCLVS